eukprot:CAMPEP_0118721952 /NCGR_PEP_ID=MMETSP0800-20121206/31071_1 /TAXON_ID=210618 ORGANISM="Striatella unipunctata, Strain CCMP2910" /NCGR_SAMPLE_ID=MMETSP0800 /ASSEMBLY_ACC=CAM_ASM_000638 /LENGTH=307 /DNA_ID=CAMNT_0006629999 /DNA_START=24 /DNA_END=945 /DNA_ORIENTATION=-
MKSRKDTLRRSELFQESLRQLAEAEDGAHQVALGDASVASPFTSRALSIQCCRLKTRSMHPRYFVANLQNLGYQQFGQRARPSTLYLNGAKQGDRQLTILGVGVAALFFFVTKGNPLPTLSPHRPPSTVLCTQALLSIALQFIVHASFILISANVALAYFDPYDPSISPDGPFHPNALNTCTFLMTSLSTVNTFVVNYRGRPFMEDFYENALFLRSVQACYAVLFVCALEIFYPLNQLLELSPLPDPDDVLTVLVLEKENDTQSNVWWLNPLIEAIGFPPTMCLLMVMDCVLSYSMELATRRCFEED